MCIRSFSSISGDYELNVHARAIGRIGNIVPSAVVYSASAGVELWLSDCITNVVSL